MRCSAAKIALQKVVKGVNKATIADKKLLVLVQRVEAELLTEREKILSDYNKYYYEKKARTLAASKDEQYGF
jgi:hypothetical protein